MNDLARKFLGKRVWMRPDDRLKTLLDRSLLRLHQTTDRVHTLETSFLRSGFQAYERDGCLFAYASRHSRPAAYTLIATLPGSDEALLPGLDADDFCRVAVALQLRHVRDQVVFHALARRDYGVCYRNCIPEQILSRDDASRLGIDPIIVGPHLERAGNTIWWQPWGGILFVFSCDCSTAGGTVRTEVLARFVGKSRQLPFHILR